MLVKISAYKGSSILVHDHWRRNLERSKTWEDGKPPIPFPETQNFTAHRNFDQALAAELGRPGISTEISGPCRLT
eukprot:g10001.t1